MKNDFLTLEEYVILHSLFDNINDIDINDIDNIYEDKLDFKSDISDGMLTIKCKYCDIKIDINKSKIEFTLGNAEKPSIEIPGKDFMQFVNLKNDVSDIKDLSTAKEKIKDTDINQNINFIKSIITKYSNQISQAIKDVSNVDNKIDNISNGKDDKLKFLWKLSLDECQVWPPESDKYDDMVKVYLEFAVSVGCVTELETEDLKNTASIVKAIFNAYVKNGTGISFTNSDKPNNIQLKNFVFDGMKFTELVKTFKSVFANANISSLVEILKSIPELAFGMPNDKENSQKQSNEFIKQLRQIVKQSIPKLKELKNKAS